MTEQGHRIVGRDDDLGDDDIPGRAVAQAALDVENYAEVPAFEFFDFRNSGRKGVDHRERFVELHRVSRLLFLAALPTARQSAVSGKAERSARTVSDRNTLSIAYGKWPVNFGVSA